MTECAVCGAHVEGDSAAHVEIDYVDKEKYGPRPDEYLLHEWCAERIFGGWYQQK